MTTRTSFAEYVVSLMRAVPADDTSMGGARVLLDVAADEWTRRAGVIGFDRVTVLDRARQRTRQSVAESKSERDDRVGRLKSRPSRDERVNGRLTRELVEQLRPMVLELRKATFGTAEPPFATLDDAAAWIEKHSVDYWAEHGWEDEDHHERHVADFDELCDRLNQADRWFRYSRSIRPLTATYWRSDGTVLERRYAKDVEPLATLQYWAEFTGEITTLPPAGLLALVLTGLGPGATVRMKDGRSGVLPGLAVVSRQYMPNGAEQVIFTVDVRELTDRNLRLLRQFVTRGPSPKRTTSKQQRVLEVVRQFGGPPPVKYERAFWKRVAKRLRMSDWRAVARRFYRAPDGKPDYKNR